MSIREYYRKIVVNKENTKLTEQGHADKIMDRRVLPEGHKRDPAVGGHAEGILNSKQLVREYLQSAEE